MSRTARQVQADHACFVCGPENRIGLRAVFRTDLDSATSFAELKLKADYQGWQGVVHGGILAALLDEACIYACRARAEQCVTGELQVRYRKPVPVGAQVQLSGELLDSNRKVLRARAQLKIDGTLHAEATARVFVLDDRGV